MVPDDDHYAIVAELLTAGEVVPFLGAGANLTDRPENEPWVAGSFPPSGAELAKVLAKRTRFPDRRMDLLRVSQYTDATLGAGQLYKDLRAVFDADYPPTSLHRLLARIPGLLRERSSPQLIILTTNYDDLVERALAAAGELFDVVWYEAKPGPLCGRLLHRLPDGEVAAIEIANTYDEFDLSKRPVVVKLHGAIDRTDSKGDSYVITEDSYIRYLVGTDVGEQIPASLKARLTNSHFLFLGYAMRDWNLRVILGRISEQQLDLKSWAVQREPKDAGTRKIEEALWRGRGDVDLLFTPLNEYVERLGYELFPPS
jgi:hypothetical protein